MHIRDIRTIIETLAEHATQTQDPVELARRVRIALSPAIVQQIYGPTRELSVIAIEPGLERSVVAVLGPEPGVGGDHAVERSDPPAAGLIHQIQPDAHLFALALLDDAIAEFGMVAGVHLIHFGEDAAVADDEMGEIADVMDGDVIADIAGDDDAAGDAGRQSEVVMFEH
ncbi:MAG: Flagellar biosynthesis protein FlhA [bacterium ADurb.Bin431]|nr:MAG: Flagellar biosynthesis protein FlhA [bacterium ADurb.Bin431]